jgi:hypothetical protein
MQAPQLHQHRQPQLQHQQASSARQHLQARRAQSTHCCRRTRHLVVRAAQARASDASEQQQVQQVQQQQQQNGLLGPPKQPAAAADASPTLEVDLVSQRELRDANGARARVRVCVCARTCAYARARPRGLSVSVWCVTCLSRQRPSAVWRACAHRSLTDTGAHSWPTHTHTHIHTHTGFRSTRRTKLVCTIGPSSCSYEV